MTPKPRRAVTLKDIAKAAGCSANTVSRALRGKEDIAVPTRRKIAAIADELGYINNSLASSLRLGRSGSIAVILGDISNPHFGIMMKEMESRARWHGYTPFLLNSSEDDAQEKEAIQAALNKSVDGIIICPAQHGPANIRYLAGTGVPFVEVGRASGLEGAASVVCNDELGGWQATRHLLENGHRRIAVFTGPAYISSARERLAGYMRAHEELGVAVDAALVREVPVTAAGQGEAIDAFLDEELPFSAVFAFSDMVAWEVWERLLRRSVRVPQDCSLVGFDHIQSRLAIPHALCTVSSYKARMSTLAVDCLVEKMNGGAGGSHVIDTQLVLGETVQKWE